MTKPDNCKPFPVRLCELKPELQKEASERKWSLHFLIKEILKSHVKKAKRKKKSIPL